MRCGKTSQIYAMGLKFLNVFKRNTKGELDLNPSSWANSSPIGTLK